MAARTFAYAEAEANSGYTENNTSAPGTTNLTLTHTPGDSERWWYFANMTGLHGNATTDIIARLYQETAATELGLVNTEPQDTTNFLNFMWGYEHTYGAAPGSQNIKLQSWSEGAGTNHQIAYAHIFGIKAEANDFYEAVDGDSTVISAVFATKVTLTETLTGNYAFFCFAEIGGGSNGNPHTVRADYSGAKYGSMLISTPDNATFRTWSTAFVLEGLSGSQTVLIEVNSANGDLVTDLHIRRARIFALCLDNFANYDFAENRTPDNNTTTTPEDQVSLTFTPLAARDHIAIAAQLGIGNDGATNAFQNFIRDASTICQQEEEPNIVGDMNPLFAFRVESLSGSPVFKTQKWTESGGDAGADEACILVIDLETGGGDQPSGGGAGPGPIFRTPIFTSPVIRGASH